MTDFILLLIQSVDKRVRDDSDIGFIFTEQSHLASRAHNQVKLTLTS